MHWPIFWWIFPLLFFVMMFFMFFFMMRGGVGCMWRGRMIDRPHDSAVEILNKRYARGEIGKQEYEEKMGAITRAR